MKEREEIALSGIQHFAFCRRQWALIHIEKQWADNTHTVEGNITDVPPAGNVSRPTRGEWIEIAPAPRRLRISPRLAPRGASGLKWVSLHGAVDALRVSPHAGRVD